MNSKVDYAMAAILLGKELALQRQREELIERANMWARHRMESLHDADCAYCDSFQKEQSRRYAAFKRARNPQKSEL